MSKPSPSRQLPRKFGLSTAVYVVLASMIGSGILVSPGFMLWSLQSYTLIFALWVVGGLMAVCGALCVAEMAAAMPKAGGEYVYLKSAMGPLPAFLSGWTSLVMGFSAPIAVNAHVCATYLLATFRTNEEGLLPLWWVKGLAAAMIIAVSIPNMIGHKAASQTQKATTWIKTGLYALLVVLAFGLGHWREPVSWEIQPRSTPGLSIILTQLYFVLFAYLGWNASTYIAGEIEKPEINLPRSLFIGIAMVMVLYLGVNAVIFLALPPDSISSPQEAERVIYLATDRLFGEKGSSLISGLIGLTFLAGISAYIVTGPRVYYAMAMDGLFPKFASKIHPSTQTPVQSTCLQSGLALLILFSFNLESLYQYTAFGLSCFSMLIVACVLILRRTKKDMPRPYRMPLYPIPAAVYLGVSVFMAYFALQEWTIPSLVSLGTILLGIPAYFYFRFKRDKAGD